jgi:hypothetical protein
MPKPKIAAVERFVQEQMLAMLEWASDRPDKWHKIGNLEATKKVAELLEKRGVIETWPETNLYRIKPKKVHLRGDRECAFLPNGCIAGKSSSVQ